MLPKFRELTDKFLEDLRQVKSSKEDYAAAMKEVAQEIEDEFEDFVDAEGLDPEDFDDFEEDDELLEEEEEEV